MYHPIIIYNHNIGKKIISGYYYYNLDNLSTYLKYTFINITVAILITQDQTKIYCGLLKYKQIT